mgnify:CR=1 FL=1
MKKEAYTIAATVERETEKANLVKFLVTWNGDTHEKSLWIPKSQMRVECENIIVIAKWYADKLSKENAFKCYSMKFLGMFEGLVEL